MRIKCDTVYGGSTTVLISSCLTNITHVYYSSVQSLSLSNSLWSHGLQHARTPCPSPTPRAYSNSCPLSQWCHPTISSSVIPVSSHLQSTKHRVPFKWVSSTQQVAKFWSFSFSISPFNEYSRLISFRTNWLDLLAVQGTLKSLLQTTVENHQFFGAQLFYSPTLTSIHDYWKNHSVD